MPPTTRPASCVSRPAPTRWRSRRFADFTLRTARRSRRASGTSATPASGRPDAAAIALAIAAGTPQTGGSPMPLAPNGPSGAGTSTIRVSIGGTWSVLGQRVLGEGAALELAVLVVVELLEQRPADALRGAAVHLALDQRRVERLADVLRDHVGEHGHAAGLAIDPHVGEVRGGARRAADLGAAAVALDRLVRAAERVRLGREVGDLDAAAGRCPEAAPRRRRARGPPGRSRARSTPPAAAAHAPRRRRARSPCRRCR